VVQTYEISMAIAVKIIRLLGGPEARPNVISFMHDQQGSDAAYRETLGCRVRFRQTRCGFELSHRLADRRIESADPETRRIAAKYVESNYLPRTASLSDRVEELTRRLVPTGQCSVDAIADQLAMHPRSLQRGLATEGRAMSGPDRAGAAGPGGEVPRRTRAAPQPDRRLARLHGAEHPQSLVPTLVREDTSAVPTGPSIASPSSDRNPQSPSIVTRRHPGPTPEEPTGRAVNTLMLSASATPMSACRT
jgi:Arabinose-binding domain of AraC transcription regulator, N-term